MPSKKRTNRRFPLCQEQDITYSSIVFNSLSSVFLKYYSHDTGYVNYKAMEHVVYKKSNFMFCSCKDDDAIENMVDVYYDDLKKPIDVLAYHVDLKEAEHYGIDTIPEDPKALPKLKAAIRGRPIEVKLLIEKNCRRPNDPTPKFLREYVNYRMFICETRKADTQIEINEKMVRCEFLAMRCRVTNPQRLQEFTGWGLALEQADEKGFGFDFYCTTVKKWFSGEKTQYRYLALECKVDMDFFNQLTSLGTVKEYLPGMQTYEITRDDGEICRLKCDEYGSKTKVVFYLGPRTDELDRFDITFEGHVNFMADKKM